MTPRAVLEEPAGPGPLSLGCSIARWEQSRPASSYSKRHGFLRGFIGGTGRDQYPFCPNMDETTD